MGSSPSAGVSHYLDPLQPGSVGTGARLYGGRWNPQGISVVYAAESRALATVEYLVHVPLSLVPRDLSLVTLHIPDGIPYTTITIADLPANWRSYPPPPALADLGAPGTNAGKFTVSGPVVSVTENFSSAAAPSLPSPSLWHRHGQRTDSRRPRSG